MAAETLQANFRGHRALARASAAWALALVFAGAGPADAAEATFSAQARAAVTSGDYAGARGAAIDAALSRIFGEAVDQVARGIGASDAEALQRRLAARRDDFIASYTIRTEIPTETEYLVAVDGTVNMTALEGAARGGGPRFSSPATEASGDLIEIAVDGVRSFQDLEAVGVLLARDVPGVRGSTLYAVKGTRVRFRVRHAGGAERLGSVLNGRSLAGRELRLQRADATDVALILTDAPASGWNEGAR